MAAAAAAADAAAGASRVVHMLPPQHVDLDYLCSQHVVDSDACNAAAC